MVAEYEAAVAGTLGGQLAALKAASGERAPVDIDWGCLKNLGKIGSGTFGTVLMMQDTRTLETYAMKVGGKKVAVSNSARAHRHSAFSPKKVHYRVDPHPHPHPPTTRCWIASACGRCGKRSAWKPKSSCCAK